MKRLSYQEIYDNLTKKYSKEMLSLFSTKNEPLASENVFGGNNYYPDMYRAYKAFHDYYKIPEKNFILCNGAENAFRAALLCLVQQPDFGNSSEVAIETPGWGLAKVICNSFGVPYREYSYHPEKDERGKRIFVPDSVGDAGIVYATIQQNNLIEHNMPDIGDHYCILDETYHMTNLLLARSSGLNLNDKTIVIGSFSKLFSPALRLGYVIFPDCFSEKMQMLREQYISQDAVRFLKSNVGDYGLGSVDWRDIYEQKRRDIENISQDKFPIVSWHPTYITTELSKDYPLLDKTPHKEFSVDGIEFRRFGRPVFVEVLYELLRRAE